MTPLGSGVHDLHAGSGVGFGSVAEPYYVFAEESHPDPETSPRHHRHHHRAFLQNPQVPCARGVGRTALIISQIDNSYGDRCND